MDGGAPTAHFDALEADGPALIPCGPAAPVAVADHPMAQRRIDLPACEMAGW